MSQPATGAGEFLGRLVAKLSAAAIPHMVFGSFASSFHGVPRSSQDLDLVVDPKMDSLRRLLADLPQSDYYVDSDTATDALHRRGQFNVIDMATGWKADLIVRKARPFSIKELERRQEGEVLGVHVPVASPEDVLLAKLEWAQQGGGSDLLLRDAAGILRVRKDTLDRGYIERWVADLGLDELWKRIQ